MSDRLRAALARALDEDRDAEAHRENEQHRERGEQFEADQRKQLERTFQAAERTAMALQSIAESLSRISINGLSVHVSR